MQEQEFVCFCLNKRHPNIFMGRRLPSNCRYCNSQFDLMNIIPKAEAEAKGLLKMPEEAAPQVPEEPTAAPEKPSAAAPQQSAGPAPAGLGMGQPAAPQPTGFGMGQPSAQPAGFGMGQPSAQPAGFGMGQPAAQPTGFGMGQSAPQPAGFGMGHSAPQPAGFGMGQPAGFGMKQPAPPQSGHSADFFPQPGRTPAPAAQACSLDFFGEKIAVPQEGGWLGRSAIGAQWFKGNLLISREHVKIVPMADGRAEVGPDKSLNGVSVTVGGVKKTLGRSETAVLSPGDTLWLYNIPLQLERK